MGYRFFLGDIVLPIAPSSLSIRHASKLKKFDLVSGTEIVIPCSESVSEISFSALLPQSKYPFAEYSSGFVKGEDILADIVKLKASGKPFRFIALRKSRNGKDLFSTNVKAVFSELRIREDANEGLDIYIDVKLSEYRDFSVKKVLAKTGVSLSAGVSETIKASGRATDEIPCPSTYSVVKDDCLWLIAQRFLGDGSRYKEIYDLNKSEIDAKNRGTGNPVYTIYPKQVFKLP